MLIDSLRTPGEVSSDSSPAIQTTLLNLNRVVCCHCHFYRPPSWAELSEVDLAGSGASTAWPSLAEGDLRGRHGEGSKAFRADTNA